MRRFVAITLTLATVFSLAGFGINAYKPVEKETTVAVASTVQTDCNLSVFVDGVLTTTLDTAFNNAEALQQGSELEINTGSCVLDSAIAALDFFGSGAKNLKLYLKPVDGKDYSEFFATYTKKNGGETTISLGAFYDPETGEIFGCNYQNGVFETGFNYNYKNKVFYAMNDCWQRQYGFMPLFDVAASCIGYNYITRRIFFDYGGKEWMVQIWKGNYHWDIFVGGEVGIYNRPAGTINGWHYDCVTDEEMIPMTMKVYDSEQTYVDRSSDYPTWWMTGFNLAGHRASLCEIKLESTFTFPNAEMCAAFAAAASKTDGVTCTSDGVLASIKW